MTTTPTPTTVPVTGAGIGFTAAFSEINGNFSAIQAWGQSVDTLLAQLASQLYTPPVAAYTAPAVGGLQVYGANGTPWATAASTGKLLVQANPYLVNGGGSWQGYADSLSLSAGTVFTVTADSAAAAFNFRTVTIAAGVPSVTSGPLALNTPVAATAWFTSYPLSYPIVAGAVALSANAVKILYGGIIVSPSPSEFAASAIVTNTGGVLAQTNNYYNSTANTNQGWNMVGWNAHKRGLLVGSQSWLAQTYNDANASFVQGWHLLDRGPTASGMTAIANGGTIQWYDNVGGGFFLRFYPSTRPVVDGTNRATVELDYVDDTNISQVATLRIVGQTYGSIQGLYVLSSTLAALFYTDASGNRWLSAIGINTAAPPATALTLLGTTNATSWSAAGLSVWTSGIMAGVVPLYSATDIYIPTTYVYPTLKLSHYSFNTSTLVWSYVNQVTVTLGGASSGAQTTAIAGLTGASIASLFMSGTDQLCALYYATATTNGFWMECFTLS